MIAMLCWIVGCFGLAIAAVHLAHQWQQLVRGVRPAPWMHVVLVTENDERHIEWVIRAYSWFAWLKGRKLHFTFVDSGSTDDTFPIASRVTERDEVSWSLLAIQRDELDMTLNELKQRQSEEEVLVVIEPRRQEDWRKVPFKARSAL
ncbi:glycosyltransferase [Paenibacillus alvei]|uniref:Glycosyltransferase n=1 Tax=Paenibacillus alvei TaxID=44250 RepID=A0AAP6ZX39_PAEAL|nr:MULTISPECIES: glycosyltransferase [Paenibacillus]MBG9735074.1 glycosyltransferase [Paenibacillus alvei]MBG9743532.1 glycosyltransferase [Paenibacillus alvei]MCY7485240.1 glycosyltransferase [Paenibacillus alvei]MCY9579922.1 glycosyltransferase [Paenibacillus alvei]MCY9584099.1 glycosyltransferase [Paenibacillus alvei]